MDAKKEYEIVYLDIELSSTRGSMNGIEALWRYKQVFPNIIAALVTVHEKEVRKGYFVGAYRYIYKRNLEEEIQEMLEGEATKEKREYLQKENQLWQEKHQEQEGFEKAEGTPNLEDVYLYWFKK